MAAEQCPISSSLPNAGGQIDATVGKNFDQQLRYTYAPAYGVGVSDAPCALRELSQQAVSTPNRDKTLACGRCTRAVRLQSKKINAITSRI